jgi:hypothetical protein
MTTKKPGFDADHTRWAIDKRSEIQHTLLALRDYALSFDEEQGFTTQQLDLVDDLIAAGFSLWRAAFLAGSFRDFFTVRDAQVRFTASRLAQAIADHLPRELNIRAAPILAFKTGLPSGSPREISVIQGALQCEFEILTGQSIVLIDDICVTGAHLTACARFLRCLGAEVGVALCLSKCVESQHPSPLQVMPEDVEDRHLASTA